MSLAARLLPHKSFARGIMTLAAGTLGAQAILIASSPILTRLYNPEDFGLFSVFISMQGMVGSIAALRFELAIPLPEDERSAVALGITGGTVVFLLSLALLVVVLGYSESLAAQFNTPVLAPYLWLLPTAFLANGLFIVLNMLCVRHERYDQMAKAKVLQSLITVLTQMIGFTFGGLALIIGRVLGNLAAVTHLGSGVARNFIVVARTLKPRDLWQVAKNYQKFPLISTWAALASNIGSSVTPLLFASYFGVEMAGYYAVTMMVMVVPMSVIGVAVHNAFYRKAIDAHKAEVLSNLIQAVQSRLVLAAMPILAFSAFFLPDLFVLVFGDAWLMSGILAVWILPWMFFQITIAPCTGIFPIIDRLGVALLFDVSLAVAPFVAFSLTLWLGRDALVAVQLLSAIASFAYLTRASVAYRLSGGKMFWGVVVVFKVLPVAVFGVLPVLIARNLSPETPVGVHLLAIVLSASLIVLGTHWAWKRLPSMDPILNSAKPES